MSRTIRRLGVAAATVGLLALGACGGSGDDGGDQVASAGGAQDPADPAQADTALDGDAQALVFAQCMRDNGVDMPDPAPGQEGLVETLQSVTGDYDQATMEQAFAACQDLMPRYSQERMHEESDMLDFAECLREQGLEVSDNPFNDIHSGAFDQAELDAALEQCRDELTEGGQ